MTRLFALAGSCCTAFALHAAELPAEAQEREIATLTAAIEKSPAEVRLFSQRGDAHLFLGHFREAVADFEKMIALDPAQTIPHWRLGIAYYFAGDFAKSALRFQKYDLHDQRDRENGIWKFLAQAKGEGIETARREMLEYTAFDREPFPSLYEMFAGKKSAADVLAHIATDLRGGDTRTQFFAHYYIGLYDDLLGERDSALKHLRTAVALYPSRAGADHGGPGYMWDVARVHLATLTR